MRKLMILCSILVLHGVAAALPRIVTTNADLFALVTRLGEKDVEVVNILPAGQEPHSMPLRPSVIQKIRQAQWLITIGLDHEPWLPDAINSSGNQRVAPGAAGYVDCSRGVRLAQIPTGQVDRSRGDLHVFGNTHYWLDPENVKIISVHITNALSAAVPQKREEIRNRARKFLGELAQHEQKWRQETAALRGAKVVTYHASFPYLSQFVGFDIVGTIELKPGIEPTPSHLGSLIDMMKAQHIKVILMEPWYNRTRAGAVANQTGAKVVSIQPSTPEGTGILEHIDSIMKLLAESLHS